MLSYNANLTSAFQRDQQISWRIEYWDTPFLALDGDVASAGIRLDVREPHASYPWSQFRSSFVADFDNATRCFARVTDGRTDQLVGYWAGGAPAHHGVTTNGRVAYRFRCYLRPPAGRGWFDSSPTPAFFLAVAGQGRMHIQKVRAVSGGGATTVLLAAQDVTEQGFLENGYVLLPTINDMAAGDYLEIYYIQDAAYDPWGGFVVKAVAASRSSSNTADQALAAAAPVLGCGLVDDDSARTSSMTPRDVVFAQNVEVTHRRGAASTCVFELPLLNPAVHDGFGWEWYRPTSDAVGQLQLWDAGQVQFSVRRKRLVRVWAGWPQEQYPLFTGQVHDFGDPTNGLVRVECQSFEARLLERFDKNLPDPVSYMTFGFNALEETADPVYGIAAYDNWPMEYVLWDLTTRAGVDASLTRQAYPIPSLTGTPTYI